MIHKNHIERVSVNMAFPDQKGRAAYCVIYIHRTINEYFKNSSQKEIELINKSILKAGKAFFGNAIFINDCKATIDKRGLVGWDCLGNATGFDFVRQNEDWLEYYSHNVDTADQLQFLLATVMQLRDTAEVHIEKIKTE